jgi:hypothetical protein
MSGATVPLVIFGVFIVLAVSVLLAPRLRGWRKKKEEEFYYFFCPGCKRKFRYRPSQVGHRAKCTQCDQQWVFPPVSQSKKAGGDTK